MEGWSMCRKRRLVPSIQTSCGRWRRIIRHIWRLVSWFEAMEKPRFDGNHFGRLGITNIPLVQYPKCRRYNSEVTLWHVYDIDRDCRKKTPKVYGNRILTFIPVFCWAHLNISTSKTTPLQSRTHVKKLKAMLMFDNGVHNWHLGSRGKPPWSWTAKAPKKASGCQSSLNQPPCFQELR